MFLGKKKKVQTIKDKPLSTESPAKVKTELEVFLESVDTLAETKIGCRKLIDDLCSRTYKEVEKILINKSRNNISIMNSIAKNDFNDEDEEDKDTLIKRCKMLDREARKIVLELIYDILSKYNIDEDSIDKMLTNYYINYYGSPSDITTLKNPIVIKFIQKVLISSNSDFDTKMSKLSQIVYQELFGLGPLDEFAYLGVDEKYRKVEELMTTGPNELTIKVSNINCRFNKVVYTEEGLKKIVNRLAVGSVYGKLSKENPYQSFDSPSKDRITISMPPKSRYYDLNLRVAYEGLEITPDIRVKNNSSTRGIEDWYQDMIGCGGRYLVLADQAAGKSSLLRSLLALNLPTSIVAVLEDNFELKSNINNEIIIKEMRLDKEDPTDIVDECVRVAATAIYLGEIRKSEHVQIYMISSQRSSGGCGGTGHAVVPHEWISIWVQLLIQGKYVLSEESAISSILNSVDFLVFPSSDSKGEMASGKRFIKSIYEVPKRKNYKSINNIEFKKLFDSDEKFDMKFVDNISEETYKSIFDRSGKSVYLDNLRGKRYDY